MKKKYVEPEIEVIRYNTEDVILTSSHHHCGVGSLTDYNYEDANENGECDDVDNYHCGTIGSGDYICEIHEIGCTGDCTVVSDGEEGT